MSGPSVNISDSQSRSKESSDERKYLGLVQESKQKQSVLMVSNGNVRVLSNKTNKRKHDENTVPGKKQRLDGIYEDPKPLRKKQKTQASVAVQTEESRVSENASESSTSTDVDQSEKILNMLTSDIAPPEYWEEIAEKRREALEESLIENKRLDEENKILSEENQTLKKEVSHLKEKNELLDELVKEAKDLAEMVESLTDRAEAAADAQGRL